jgi:hypothetical protein
MSAEALAENVHAFVAAVVAAQPKAKSVGGKSNIGKAKGTSKVSTVLIVHRASSVCGGSSSG